MASVELQAMRDRLTKSPAARARFLADTLDLLEKNGVDVNNAQVVDNLGLNLDLADPKRFLDGLVSTTNIITITG